MKYMTGLVVSVLAIQTTVTLCAQEPGKEDVLQALQSFTGKDVCLSGTIEHEEFADTDAPAVPAGLVPKNGMIDDTTGPQLSGDLDLAIMSNGTLVLATKGPLPAIKIYQSGESMLCNQTHTEKPIFPKRMLETLGKVFDWDKLANSVATSGKVRVENKGTSTNIRFVLDKSFLQEDPKPAPAKVPAMGGIFGLGGIVGVRVKPGDLVLQPKVVDLIATFTMSPSKELLGIAFEIQYDDPVKEIAKRAFRAGETREERREKLEKIAEVTLGNLVRLDFDLQKQIPAKLDAFAKEAQNLLSTE